MTTGDISSNDWCDKGERLIKQGNFEIAIQYFDKALEINPRLARAWNNRAGVLGLLGRYEESIKCCDKALELNPKFAEAWHNKGSDMAIVGRYEEAIECYDKTLEIQPKYAEAWFNKGLAFEELAKKTEDPMKTKHPSAINTYIKYRNAIECYERALDIDPKHEGARKNREYLLDKLGRKISKDKSNFFKDKLIKGLCGLVGEECPQCGHHQLASVVGGNMSLYECSKCGKKWTEKGWR